MWLYWHEQPVISTAGILSARVVPTPPEESSPALCSTHVIWEGFCALGKLNVPHEKTLSLCVAHLPPGNGLPALCSHPPYKGSPRPPSAAGVPMSGFPAAPRRQGRGEASGAPGVASDAPRRLSSRVMKERQKSHGGENATKSESLRKRVLSRGEGGMTHQVSPSSGRFSGPRRPRDSVSSRRNNGTRATGTSPRQGQAGTQET